MKLSEQSYIIIMAALEQALENANEEEDVENINQAIRELEAIGTY